MEKDAKLAKVGGERFTLTVLLSNLETSWKEKEALKKTHVGG